MLLQIIPASPTKRNGTHALQITYPKSFLKLLLIGFALAMLPLLFAFGNAALYLDRLATQSSDAVTQAVQATRASRALVEQIAFMERSARQYFVLEDELLLENYEKAHEKFVDSWHDLDQLPMTSKQRLALSKLSAEEQALFQNVAQHSTESSSIEEIVGRFADLTVQAQDILDENNRQIDRESAILAETAERTQQIMLWQTLTLIPVALLVALMITFLVAQPIRRMDAAIRKLGEGDYSEPISIDGPGDLRNLGERLDWLRAQLNELDQQKQRFLRNVSHELKTPLTAIREGSELLSDEVGGPLTPQQREIAGILRESSLRLQKMIENLLSFTAAQFHAPQLNLETVDLTGLAEAILADYSLTISNKNINIQRDFFPTLIQADREKIHSVLDNLISNAVKYTSPSSSIRISITHQAHQAIIEVHDGGPGVMASDKAKLFEPFYRGDSAHESLVSGSGLGLSIAKEYVDAHGGEIILLPSERGARFRVTLPLKALTK
ncbi:periplasmic sensor signal transduction histidine kinase [Methylobacillus flagellatus KT]|uniref:histidine kinase n=1 Tax=Methylobacillus flagellatus (strain ATCC 51484 / DSM 6875 / VKM B-1610 / KT) TaxID=265072 RepID=Q1H2G2_METFK|nr:periplasmic sensor signal transduction histidine kinase [Methylobacillus flagellatus KT]ABE49325.1 periplasmic sensor signal transduction histidine kinase [Methylobacillus flagellatus KT]